MIKLGDKSTIYLKHGVNSIKNNDERPYPDRNWPCNPNRSKIITWQNLFIINI